MHIWHAQKAKNKEMVCDRRQHHVPEKTRQSQNGMDEDPRTKAPALAQELFSFFKSTEYKPSFCHCQRMKSAEGTFRGPDT